MKKTKSRENLAFVFPPGLSQKIKSLQNEIGAKSPGEVLVKAISLLEITIGRRIEIRDQDSEKKWEINEFQELDTQTEIDNSQKQDK